MSLISGGVPALVNHRGFLAGAGDTWSSPSSLWRPVSSRPYKTLIQTSLIQSRLGPENAFSHLPGHLWMSFKGVGKWRSRKVGPCVAHRYLASSHVLAQASGDERKWLHNNEREAGRRQIPSARWTVSAEGRLIPPLLLSSNNNGPVTRSLIQDTLNSSAQRVNTRRTDRRQTSSLTLSEVSAPDKLIGPVEASGLSEKHNGPRFTRRPVSSGDYQAGGCREAGHEGNSLPGPIRTRSH
ncbi:unnamed protein product [Pleuronectes platessa]|uniref:Uncharacterized protein n=1 Tax=Pleuronectes platessa TaxID=8262 RepID=A0A9N7V1N1_PLEPL|nr:unnamed protein product [Pleuronectes platessa]